MNSKSNKESRISKNATSGRFSKAGNINSAVTDRKDIEGFVKGFYKKNGKAMTQLAYE